MPEETITRPRAAVASGETTSVTLKLPTTLYALLKGAADDAEREVPAFITRALKKLDAKLVIEAGQ